MATARQLARLVSVVSSISAGAVRTHLGRSETTRKGLGVLPRLMRLVSESVTPGTSTDEQTTRQVAAFLCRLILRYGTMQRALEVIAQGKRHHEAISLERAGAWSQILAAPAGSIESLLRRHQSLRIVLVKWMGEQGPGLDKELGEFERWLDGPLPGTDDAGEFPVLTGAPASGGGAPGAGTRAAEPPPPEDLDDIDPLAGDALPKGVRSPGVENDDIRLIRAMLASAKRPAGLFGERVLSDKEQAALDRLRTSDEAYSRALAAIADRDLASAQACVKMLEDLADDAGLVTLRADLHYLEQRFDEAIPFFRRALSLASKSDLEPVCKINLAMALMHAERGSGVDRAREARQLIDEAVQALPAGSEPWGVAHLQRGLAQMCPPIIDRAEAARAAISSFESAAKVFGPTRCPANWAETMYWLGGAWMELPAGDRRENVERAIARFNDALAALSKTDTPDRWASTQMEMGIAWERMPAGNRAEALEYAIGCFTSALTVRRKERDPVSWARIQNNLGNLWVQFPEGNQRQNIERAIAHQQAALEVWSHEDRRLEWATTQSNLGNAWALLPAEGDQRERNLRRAIACYKSALEVRTRGSHPIEWATTLNNLGSALLHLPTGGRGANIKEAIDCYQQALEVRSRERFPLEWAKVQANLGNAWVKSPAGYKADNLAKAVSHYQASLEVYSRQRFPRQHTVIAQRLREAQSQLRQFAR